MPVVRLLHPLHFQKGIMTSPQDLPVQFRSPGLLVAVATGQLQFIRCTGGYHHLIAHAWQGLGGTEILGQQGK